MHVLKDPCSICGGNVVIRKIEIEEPDDCGRIWETVLVDSANCLNCLHEVVVPCEAYNIFVFKNGRWLDE